MLVLADLGSQLGARAEEEHLRLPGMLHPLEWGMGCVCMCVYVEKMEGRRKRERSSGLTALSSTLQQKETGLWGRGAGRNTNTAGVL